MRITFVINSLRLGGAQRALINVLEAFHGRGHTVSLVTLYRKETDFFRLSEDIAHIALGVEKETSGIAQKIIQNARRVTAIRQAIVSARPNIVISFLPETNILVLLALAGTRCPVLVVEQNDPLRSNLDAPWRILRRLTYPAAAILVCSSKGVSDGFGWLPPSKRRVIFNTITHADIDTPAESQAYANPRRRHVIAMGRLHRQKGFDLLIDAFSQIAAHYRDWDLTIWGEGGERHALESQIKQANLGDRVYLPGATPNPQGVMKAAQLFVLSSRYEGFGNVLIEAMACNLPIISFDCPSGPGEIIQDGVNGVLVSPEDVTALAEAMEQLLRDDRKRESLASAARRALERFVINNVFPQWEELLQRILSQ